MSKKNLTITIGIPAYNEEANIGLLLENIRRQKIKGAIIKKIIVVSDRSEDNTASIVNSINDRRITLIDNKKRKGLNLSENEIMKKASTDILVIFNGDVLPADSNCVNELVKPLITNNNIGIVGAHIVTLPASKLFERIISFSHTFKDSIYIRMNKGRNIYMCHGRGRAFNKTFYKNFTLPLNAP